MMHIKICGLRRPEDIASVNLVRPDYVGFVFFQKSKRYITPDQAVAIGRDLIAGIRRVGVFVDADPEEVIHIYHIGAIDIAQLHGHEDDAYIARLKAAEPLLPLIQAVRIDTAADIEKANASPADLVLLDHGDGGTGQSFDWTLLSGIRRPYILAGGLTPDNVANAIRSASSTGNAPFGVDVSSGVETGGLKDSCKVQQFTNNVRKDKHHD